MGTQQPCLLSKIRDYCPPIPDMITGGEQVNATLQKLIGDLWRDSKSCRSILNIGHAKVDTVFVNQAIDPFLEDPPARLAEYVSYE